MNFYPRTRCLFGTKRLLGRDKHDQWCNTLDRQELIPENSNEILHDYYIVKLENFRLWKFELRERADLYKKTKYQKFLACKIYEKYMFSILFVLIISSTLNIYLALLKVHFYHIQRLFVIYDVRILLLILVLLLSMTIYLFSFPLQIHTSMYLSSIYLIL